MQYIYNAIRTPDGTVLESEFRHDYRTYTDANGLTYMVDGGQDYLRRNVHKTAPYEELSVKYDPEGHTNNRYYLKWGTYGKDGDQPLRYVRIKDMSTNHLHAVLKNCLRINPVLKLTMEREIEGRNEHGVWRDSDRTGYLY